jgi:hypothetical protein
MPWGILVRKSFIWLRRLAEQSLVIVLSENEGAKNASPNRRFFPWDEREETRETKRMGRSWGYTVRSPESPPVCLEWKEEKMRGEKSRLSNERPFLFSPYLLLKVSLINKFPIRFML